MKELIFDLDGTLWDPTEVVIKSWNTVLKQYPQVREGLTEEALSSVLGLQIPQIGEKLFPYLEKTLSRKIMDECCAYENTLILEQGGRLYDGMVDTIKLLSRTHPLFIISNCNSGYIEAFLEYHGLRQYFTDIECFGDTKLSKGENIKIVIERNKLQDPIYVGDTQSDYEACKLAEVPFVFAAYGFGQAEGFTHRLSDITELPSLIHMS